MNNSHDDSNEPVDEVPTVQPAVPVVPASSSRGKLLWFAAAAAVVVTLSVVSSSPTPAPTPEVSSSGQMREGAEGGSMMSNHELHHGGASLSPVSESAYLVDMIPHHEEAIRAARQLLVNTDREEMRSFARVIISVQQAEVDTMRRWLAERYPDINQVSGYMPMMGDYSGMTGDAVDRAFLEDMIPHHMTAVMMSRQLVQKNIVVHDDVEPFATTIAKTQSEEISQMMVWLPLWFGPEAGYGMMGQGMHS